MSITIESIVKRCTEEKTIPPDLKRQDLKRRVEQIIFQAFLKTSVDLSFNYIVEKELQSTTHSQGIIAGCNYASNLVTTILESIVALNLCKTTKI